MLRVGLLLLLSLPASISSAQSALIDLPAITGMDEVADMLIQAYDERSVLLVGEMHGTVETPDLVNTLVHRLAESGPVTLGVEVTRQEQQRINDYLESNGSTDALSRLLSGQFWEPTNSDGRRSEAMVALLTSIRGYRERGSDIKVVALDSVDFFGAAFDRNEGLAREIDALAPNLTVGPVIVLIGNFHARMAPFRGRLISVDGEVIDPIVPAGSRIRGVPVTSVNVTGCSGQFWGCIGPESCGPQPLPAQCPVTENAAVSQLDPVRDGYHLSVLLPKLTASPPIQ